MSLNSKRLSLADMRLKISETEADLEAQFRELRELRERLRQAEFQRICKTKRGLESRAGCHRRSRLACAANRAGYASGIGTGASSQPTLHDMK